MWPGRAADHSPPSSCGHRRVELYLYYSLPGPHRACNGITLPFFFTYRLMFKMLGIFLMDFVVYL